MTHHWNTFFYLGYELLDLFTHRFYVDSELFIDYNYGMIIIKKDGNDIMVSVESRGLDNKAALKR